MRRHRYANDTGIYQLIKARRLSKSGDQTRLTTARDYDTFARRSLSLRAARAARAYTSLFLDRCVDAGRAKGQRKIALARMTEISLIFLWNSPPRPFDLNQWVTLQDKMHASEKQKSVIALERVQTELCRVGCAIFRISVAYQV